MYGPGSLQAANGVHAGGTQCTAGEEMQGAARDEPASPIERIEAQRRVLGDDWATDTLGSQPALLLGDLVEGEDIFPGQAHLIDAGLYGQVFSTAEMLAGLVRKLAANFEVVKVAGVIGNHGRIGRRGVSRPESNADAIAYKTAAMMVRDEKRIEWRETFTSGERHWHEVVEVMGRKWFLFHGDQLKGGSFGFPWYSLAKRISGWNLAIERFDYAAFGHWHTPVRVVAADGRITAFGSGSIESSNTYAQEWVAASGEPAQFLVFQSQSGLSAEYLIRLEDPRA